MLTNEQVKQQLLRKPVRPPSTDMLAGKGRKQGKREETEEDEDPNDFMLQVDQDTNEMMSQLQLNDDHLAETQRREGLFERIKQIKSNHEKMKYKKKRKAEGKYVDGDPDEILVTYPGIEEMTVNPEN